MDLNIKRNYISDDREWVGMVLTPCNKCKHRKSNNKQYYYYCKAFPKGFPDDIKFGDNQHTEIHKDQIGTIIFDQK